MPAEDLAIVQRILTSYRDCEAVRIDAPRSREAGRERFIHLNLAVPAGWTVRQGHDLTERLEADIAHELARATVFTHIETHQPADSTCRIIQGSGT